MTEITICDRTIGTGQAQPDANYPRIVSKIGKAPPQYPDIDDE
ncbi:hypothetical protein ACFSQQ_39405 [Mesorhizobium kowhaii]